MEAQVGRPPLIRGTSLNIHNGYVQISSGIAALDKILSGGFPLGSVVLVEEDTNNVYASIMLRHFIAEGILNGHGTFFAAMDVDPREFIQKLPAVCDVGMDHRNTITSDNHMKIAFRYGNLPQNEQKMPDLGHSFDLSQTMSLPLDADVTYWRGQYNYVVSSNFFSALYDDVLNAIADKLKKDQYINKDVSKRMDILRIGVFGLGSPMWMCPGEQFDKNKIVKNITQFMYRLRALIHSSHCVAMITIPSLYYELLNRCLHCSDIAMRLQSFAGTELSKNPILSDYQGFFYLTKMAPVNSLQSRHPGAVEYGFKCRRRKFHIEELHLPPDIQDSNSSFSSFDGRACGEGGMNHLIDF